MMYISCFLLQVISLMMTTEIFNQQRIILLLLNFSTIAAVLFFFQVDLSADNMLVMEFCSTL